MSLIYRLRGRKREEKVKKKATGNFGKTIGETKQPAAAEGAAGEEVVVVEESEQQDEKKTQDRR